MYQEEKRDGEGRPDDGEKLLVMDDRSREPQRDRRSSQHYLIGIGIGLIPLILFLITMGGSFSGNGDPTIYLLLSGIALLLYGALFIASIVCLCIKRIRFIGYGLLTMVIATPVISFIGCIVINTAPH